MDAPNAPMWSDTHSVITGSAEETVAAGVAFARRLRAGHVVALYGTLGAGKTQFVKGVCFAFGIPADRVSSPTFTLIQEYRAPEVTLYHFDAYRVEQVSEWYELGYEDYFFGEGLCLVEWPDRVEELLPDDAIRIRFTHLGGNKREITLLE